MTTTSEFLRHLRTLAARQAHAALSDQQLLERFLHGRSEAAFAALVQRHGPMVLSVCRRVLHHAQDAEDAFQATFLILSRKAGSIRKSESLSSWLHGVAHRSAKCLRAKARRRIAHEGRMAPPAPDDVMDDITWRELRSVLDEELQRLPEQYRAPLVLCYLEARTQDEAARQLGWSKNTFGRRMNQARQMLARRLTRRGLTLPTALTVPLLIDGVAAAALPPLLAANTIRAGLAMTTGQATGTLVSSQVAALAEAGVGSLLAKKVSITFVLLVSLMMGVGLLAHRAVQDRTLAEAPAALPGGERERDAERRPRRSHAEHGNERNERMSADSLEVHGVVRGPDGKSIKGARVYCGYTKKEMKQQAVTDAEGHYRFTLSRDDVDAKGNYEDPWEWTPIAAVADGYGLDWRHLRERDKDNRLDLRLVADDAPIEGRILDLEGRPVVGATVRILRLHATAGEDLSNFLKEWADDPHQALTGYSSIRLGGERFKVKPPISWRRLWGVYQTGLFPPLTTDKEGKFRITGLGRERLVELLIAGPGIEETELQVITHKDVDAKALNKRGPTLYGARFEHAAGPTKPITGVVRDKANGKPLAGIRILGHSPQTKVGRFWPQDIETVTDAKGAYRLTGLPKDREYSFIAAESEGANYLPLEKKSLDTAALGPLKIDFELERGVLIEGRLLDKASGKPVSGVVHYAPLPSNPRIVGRQGNAFTRYILEKHFVGKDGAFKLVAYPGPGIVYAEAATGKYLPISFALADKKLGLSVKTVSFTVGGWHIKVEGHSYRLIDPDADTKTLKCDLLFQTE